MTTTASLPSLSVEEVSIDELRPDPANPRRISEDELDALERSLRQFGFVQPVLARRDDRTVIGGHQRLVAARRLGLTTVPVTWLDVTVEQARLLGLALNKISGSWDEQLLARLLADLQATPDLDLSLSGFGEDEITDLLRSLDVRERRERTEAFDLEAALDAATKEPRTKPGDLWALDEHRLLCGDATSTADVARVLSGRQAGMAFTDPPYNVALGDHGGRQRGARRRRIAASSSIRSPARGARSSPVCGSTGRARRSSSTPVRRCGTCPLGTVQRASGGAARWLGRPGFPRCSAR